MTSSSVASTPTVTLVASLGSSLINFRGPLIKELVGRGYRVVAAAPAIDASTSETLERMGAEPHHIDLDRHAFIATGDIAAVSTLRRLLRRGAQGDAVVPYTIKPILLTGLAHRMSGTPAALVPMFTGLGVLTRTEHSGAGRALRRTLRWALRDSRAAIVQHDADRRWLRYHRIVADDTPVVVVPGSGVDTDRFAYQPLVAGGVPEVLYLGRMVPEKGIARFCDYAAAASFEARWVAVGPFEDAVAEQDLRKRFAEVGIEYRCATDDVRPHLAAARVVVLPTTYGEGIPRVIQEAMAVGRPVVVSDAPGCRVAVEHGVSGSITAPDDVASAVEAIGALCADEALASRWGRAGRERAERLFEAGRVASLTADAILGVTSDPDPSTVG